MLKLLQNRLLSVSALTPLVILLLFTVPLALQAQSTDPSPYCDLSPDCRFGIQPKILNVSFGNINNSTGCDNNNSVTYFNNLDPIDFEAGESVSGTVTVENGSFFFNDGIGIWIDFDGSGTFDTDELVFSDQNSSSSVTYNVNFKVPEDAQCGITRMRVKVDEDATPSGGDACTMLDFVDDGEVEDYDVNITNCAFQKTYGDSLNEEGLDVIDEGGNSTIITGKTRSFG
jgi:hypothetical protein